MEVSPTETVSETADAVETGKQGEPSSSSLPMCVWLRGDSDDADEFNMTAEEVMATLNIKRSRLTQISGRELRVGRKRVDRYIKPFYRQADVLAYRTWTRASATKQKNAELVERAASDIESRNKRLLEKLQEQLKTHINTELLTVQRQIIATCQHQYFVLRQQLQTTQAKHTETLSSPLPRLNRSLYAAVDKLSFFTQELEAAQKKTAADNLASIMHILQQQEQLLQSLHKITAPHGTLLTELPEQIHRRIAADFQQYAQSSRRLSADSHSHASIAPQTTVLRQNRLPIAAEKRLGWCSINPIR